MTPISVEISMYPLDADYESPIIAFIESLQAHPRVKTVTNGMSTQLFGEYDEVMDLLKEAMKPSFTQDRKIAMVFKILNIDVSDFKGLNFS